MSWYARRDMRKIHRIGGILIALPFLIVLISGLILQVKKEFDWIQPPTQKGVAEIPVLSFDRILEVASTVPEAEITSWEDIDRLDVRPDDGIVKVQSDNSYEIQIDNQTAEILQVAFRRSDIIETIHDGSWFHDAAKLWIFLPSAIVVCILWLTGIYLYFLPYYAKWKNRKRLETLKKESVESENAL